MVHTIMSLFYKRLIEPKSAHEDARRREFILNVLLFGTLVLTFVAVSIVAVNLFLVVDVSRFSRLYILLGAFFLFLCLYILSRVRFHAIAAYSFVFVYFLLAIYTVLTWGIIIPQGPLVFALVIVLAGILINTRFAIIMMLLSAVALLSIGYAHTNNILSPDTSWMGEIGGVPDALGFTVTLAVITLISWLSNREIERSLQRARTSEAALQKERDLLEVKVEERTQELKRTQLEKLTELSKFAEIGQLAAGIIHDLANPLATVSFSLEQLSEKDRSALVERALNGTEYMKRFINTARKQLQHQENMVLFSLSNEIRDVIQIVSYRAKQASVTLEFEPQSSPKTYGNPSRFDQVIANLLSNAIDAYGSVDRPDKKITITLASSNDRVEIKVTDEAAGIPKALQPKLFEPFFTTKGPQKGTGVGLSLCKGIVERDFGGTITFTSEEGRGTTFTITFPIKVSAPATHADTPHAPVLTH